MIFQKSQFCFCCCLVAFGTPWTLALQAPLSMGFPRQGYWSGFPFPSLGHLPNPGIKLKSPVLSGRFFTTEPPRKPRNHSTMFIEVLQQEHAEDGREIIQQLLQLGH